MVRDATKEGAGWWLYIFLNSLHSHLCLANLLSTNTKLINQCFDHPVAPLRPPVFLGGFSTVHPEDPSPPFFQNLHSHDTVCPQAILWLFLFSPTSYVFNSKNMRFFTFQKSLLKMKPLFCPYGLDMTYGQVPLLFSIVPLKHLGMKKKNYVQGNLRDTPNWSKNFCLLKLFTAFLYLAFLLPLQQACFWEEFPG